MSSPPHIDIAMAAYLMYSQCASSAGKAVRAKTKVSHTTRAVLCAVNGELVPLPMPMTTKKPVRNLPKSTTAPPPPPSELIKSSGLAHLAQMKLGKGAIT